MARDPPCLRHCIRAHAQNFFLQLFEQENWRGCKAQKKTRMTEMQRKARTAWAKEHLSWSSEEWSRVVFSDESTFTIQNQAGNNYVRRRPYKAYSPQCILPSIKHPTNVIIWG